MIELEKISKGHDYLDKWIVITSKASHDHGGQPDKSGRRRVLSRLEVYGPNTACTESYIVMGAFDTKALADNYRVYLSTKFVRFLAAQLSFSQDITRRRFDFVPLQDFKLDWDDEKLFNKYNLTKSEIEFIERTIQPMDISVG